MEESTESESCKQGGGDLVHASFTDQQDSSHPLQQSSNASNTQLQSDSAALDTPSTAANSQPIDPGQTSSNPEKLNDVECTSVNPSVIESRNTDPPAASVESQCMTKNSIDSSSSSFTESRSKIEHDSSSNSCYPTEQTEPEPKKGFNIEENSLNVDRDNSESVINQGVVTNVTNVESEQISTTVSVMEVSRESGLEQESAQKDREIVDEPAAKKMRIEETPEEKELSNLYQE